MKIKSLSELVTVAVADTTTATIAWPTGCHRLGITVRSEIAPATTATYNIGDGNTATLYFTALAKAVGTTGKLPLNTVADTYTPIVITPNAQPAAATGKLRITLYYLEFTAPTRSVRR
jgi:hypothetical protein